MIITPKEAESRETLRDTKGNNDSELPPEYTPTDNADVESSTTRSESSIAESINLQHADTPPPGFPSPTNYATVQRTNTAIKEKLAIDPLLIMPEFLLPPLESAETIRPNLKLVTTNGSINADVYVYGDQPMNVPGRPRLGVPSSSDSKTRPHVILTVQTSNGSATLKVRDCPVHSRAPLDIAISTSCGAVTLYLPKSFHGPIVATTSYSKIVFSREVQDHSTTFLEVDGSRTSFIGDYSGWMGTEGRGWVKDTARLSSTFAKIKVSYTDELDVPSSSGGLVSGLAKMLGF